MLRHAISSNLVIRCEVGEMPEPIVKAVNQYLGSSGPDFKLEQQDGFATHEIDYGVNYPGVSINGYSTKIYKGLDTSVQCGKSFAVFAISDFEREEPLGLVIGDLGLNGPIEFWEYDQAEEIYSPVDIDHPMAWKLANALVHPELEQ